MTDWQHKLVKTENLSVETLLKMAHPENAREHPDHQLEATEELIETIGLIDELKANINSGRIFNGHARIQIALQSGQTSLPVNWYDLTEDEERLALEQYDATTYEATYNPDKLRALMEKTKGIKADRPALQAMLSKLMERNLYGRGVNGTQPVNDPNAEWVGMPEFEQEDLSPFRTIHVHFQNETDVRQFAELVKQSITDSTRYIWYPKVEDEDLTRYKAIDNES